MKLYRLFFFERSFILIFCFAFTVASAPRVFAFVEDPSPVEAALEVEPVAIHGEWTAHLNSKDATPIQFNFTRPTEKGDYNQVGNSMKLSDLRGIPAQIAAPARTDVSFRLVRAAGTVSMDGYLQAGRGAGLWTFTPNWSLASSIASGGVFEPPRGIPAPDYFPWFNDEIRRRDQGCRL